MSDTMTLYAGDEQTVVDIDPQPDPEHPGKCLLKSPDGTPFCCEFSLKEHAYNIVLPPGSYVIVDGDNAEMFKESHSDDHVIFSLPSNNAAEFYVEQYFASIKEIEPHIVLVLRYHEHNRVVSAVLYPRDLESLPKPFFITQEGKTVWVESRGMHEKTDTDSKVEYVHHPEEIEFIVNTIFKPSGQTVAEVDPNAPKEKWF